MTNASNTHGTRSELLERMLEAGRRRLDYGYEELHAWAERTVADYIARGILTEIAE